MLLIKNGRVLDPATKTDAALDVLLDGDRIAQVGADLASSASGAEVFDAKGLIVAPGFIDLHCHLREPGGEMSETIETGTKSAASKNSPTANWCEIAQRRGSPSSPASIALSSSLNRMASHDLQSQIDP